MTSQQMNVDRYVHDKLAVSSVVTPIEQTCSSYVSETANKLVDGEESAKQIECMEVWFKQDLTISHFQTASLIKSEI